MTYLGLEDTASALAALERATAAGEIWTSTIVVNDPVFSSIRDSERFRRLVARVGLADALVAPARRPPRT